MQTEFSILLAKAGYTVPEAAAALGYSEGHIYRWKRGDETPREGVLRLLSMEAAKRKGPEGNAFTFIDLFAGIGGLRQAMESAGGRCVFTSEWDKYAQQTYLANFPDNRPIAGDIRQVNEAEIPPHDVLVAGFPCQPFSIAGVSKKNALGRAHGFDDETQGTLFFDVLRVLMHHRPAAFMLENVKNLKSHDKGRTFDVIRRKLTETLGYTLAEPRIIDAGHFVPQHRERIVLVGFREPTAFTWNDLQLPAYGQRRLRHILHPENGTERQEGHFTTGPDAVVSEKYTLTDKLWAYLQAYAEKHRSQGNGFGFGLVNGDSISRTLSARYYKDGSEILVRRGPGQNPRRLTPRECARLMGYEDNFRIPVSDTQAYKQFGNSVAVPVFAEVARIMTPHILAITGAEALRKVG